MKKRAIAFVCALALIAVFGVTLAGCAPKADGFEFNGFDAAAPDLTGLTTENMLLSDGEDGAANQAGWYATLIDNFDFDEAYAANHGLDPRIWTTSPHGLRWGNEKEPQKTNYWHDDMVSVTSDGYAQIRAEYLEDVECEVCNAVYGDKRGRYTGGFETRRVIDKLDENGNQILNNIGRPLQEDDVIWDQAFGYYETRVRFPKKAGMWSAFWLQSSWQRKIGNEGMDGTEIDVFESAFLKDNAKISRMGHALLWDGYAEGSKSAGRIVALGENDLYDGKFHTFALLWTPTHYVFYVDGKATWATDAGGVARVPEFLRFTCEIDVGDGWGPHGQKIGQFTHDGSGIFEVDYVRVYQNKNFLSEIKSDDDYTGDFSTEN